jgi:hypothetical protein
MVNLPIERLEPVRPFLRTEIDYCGPISIKEGYICLLVYLWHQGSSFRITN